MEVVEGLLKDLDLDSIPCMRVFNKVDKLHDIRQEGLSSYDGICISALDESTLPPFLKEAGEKLDAALNRDSLESTPRLD